MARFNSLFAERNPQIVKINRPGNRIPNRKIFSIITPKNKIRYPYLITISLTKFRYSLSMF